MAINIKSASNIGVESIIINVEVDINKGLPAFSIVGLPDASVKESKERVRSAIINSGYTFPVGRIVVNLAPADVRKIGSLLDLPIAIAILIQSNQINKKDLDNFIIFGELSLDGMIKRVNGTIPIILEGIKNSIDNFIIPSENVEEIEELKGMNIYPFSSLKHLINYINNEDMLPYEFDKTKCLSNEKKELNIDDIIGQITSKRALQIAAAGKHNLLFYGAPGSGKTMLARAFKTLLPSLSHEEKLEVLKIYSSSGLLRRYEDIEIPFRAPHYTITKTSLIGGGREVRAGEATLAHNGVLFLDEILEFKRDVLEVLRAPIEEGVIRIDRINSRIELPCKFILIAALNLCPCGKRKFEQDEPDGCQCTELEIRRYQNRLSSALKDRIDLFNYVPSIKYTDLKNGEKKNEFKKVKEKILLAREKQKIRFKNSNYNYNSEIRGKDIFKYCKISRGGEKLLENFFTSKKPSMRGYGKIIKVAQSIADLDGESVIKEEHLMETLTYRKDLNSDFI